MMYNTVDLPIHTERLQPTLIIPALIIAGKMAEVLRQSEDNINYAPSAAVIGTLWTITCGALLLHTRTHTQTNPNNGAKHGDIRK